jgi:hypothetical protein
VLEDTGPAPDAAVGAGPATTDDGVPASTLGQDG